MKNKKSSKYEKPPEIINPDELDTLMAEDIEDIKEANGVKIRLAGYED